MGYRLHSAKTYKVEWDFINCGFFNWLTEEVNYLIFKNCQNAYFNGESWDCSDTIEVDREEFDTLIERIRDDYEGTWSDFHKKIDKDYTREDVVEMLRDHADPDNDYIVLHWA